MLWVDRKGGGVTEPFMTELSMQPEAVYMNFFLSLRSPCYRNIRQTVHDM